MNCKLASLVSLFVSFAVQAAPGAPDAGNSFAAKCPDIGACVAAVSQLLGQHYIYDPSIEAKKVQATRGLELTRENAEELFTSMLHLSGLTRVPMGAQNSFQIVETKYAQQTAIPVLDADAQHAPSIARNWDYVTMKYKLTNPAMAAEIQRFLTDFLPRTGRASSFDTGYLFITAAGPEVERVYKLLGAYDQKLAPESKKAREARQAEAAKRAREAGPAKNG